jgi:holo-[acyl-carrier protein] synthase
VQPVFAGLRVGIDLVAVARVVESLERFGARYLQRVFTPGEIGYAMSAAGLEQRAERLAARFAAKEAAMKALGVGLGAFSFHDVEVVRQPSGAPSLRVTGGAQALALRLGVSSWKVSLTHTATMAQAVVVAE